MTSTAPTSRWWLKPLIALGIVYLVVSITISSIKTYHEVRVEHEAKRWLEQAQKDIKPSWTEDDAVSWLHENGFDEVLKGEGVHSAVGKPDEHYFAVIGYLLIEKGGVIVSPSSIYLEFFFDIDHKFLRVKSKTWPFEPPDVKPKPQGKPEGMAFFFSFKDKFFPDLLQLKRFSGNPELILHSDQGGPEHSVSSLSPSRFFSANHSPPPKTATRSACKNKTTTELMAQIEF